MIYPPIEALHTGRLTLRRLELSDAPHFYLFASDPEVCRYMHWKPHKSLQDSEDSIRTSLLRYETEPYYRWGIALADTDTLIGMIQLLGFEESENKCSFAYMLSTDRWGLGYGTEALQAVFRFAFTKMNIDLLEADHFHENTASGRAMEKAGMRWQKTIPDKYGKDGVRYDAEVYRLAREEWITSAKIDPEFTLT